MVVAGVTRPRATGARSVRREREIDMGMRFEWADVSGPGAEIWSDVELDDVSEVEVEPGTVGVSMDTGSNGIMLWGKPENVADWAEDLARRLRAGEGKSGYGEAREFVLPGRFFLVQDAEGNVYDAEQLDTHHQLRDNSTVPGVCGGDWPELVGDTWQVMAPGRIGISAEGQAGFIVPTRKVIG